MKRITIAILALVLAACAHDQQYRDYLAAQQAANAAYRPAPLFVLEAHEGQPITGIKRIEVNVPGQPPIVQQARPSEWAQVWQSGLGTFGMLGGIYLGGRAAIGLSNSIGNAATAGYPYVQAPGAITTTTQSIGGAGVIGAGSYATTANPSNVTSNTLSGSGAMGAGASYTAPVTTTTDSHPVTTTTTDTHAVTNSNNPVDSHDINAAPVTNQTCATGPC